RQIIRRQNFICRYESDTRKTIRRKNLICRCEGDLRQTMQRQNFICRYEGDMRQIIQRQNVICRYEDDMRQIIRRQSLISRYEGGMRQIMQMQSLICHCDSDNDYFNLICPYSVNFGLAWHNLKLYSPLILVIFYYELCFLTLEANSSSSRFRIEVNLGDK